MDRSETFTHHLKILLDEVNAKMAKLQASKERLEGLIERYEERRKKPRLD